MKGYRLVLLIALINFVWAPVNLFVELARRGGFSPAGLEIVRWGGIAVGLWSLFLIPAVRQKAVRKMPNLRQVLIAIVVGVILTGPSHLLYYSALGKTTTVEGTIFNAAAPIWVGVFAGLFLREKITKDRWASLGIGAFGAYVAAVGFALPSLQNGHFGWDLLYLLGTFLECFGGIIVTALARGSSGLAVMAIEACGMSLGGVLWSFVLPGMLPIAVAGADWGAWLSLGYLIACAGVFAFGAWMVMVETVPLSVMVATIAIQTPLAAILAAITVHEHMSWKLFWGTLLIFAALAIVAMEKPSARRLNTEAAPATDQQR